ncbi:MAG: hypothetical protein DRH12_16100 [Deltaproteobacteria bacterium]|nr:MAG: hypothetical protein DRH12_16100 [Deltaproteobacteria bacterium]
MATYRQIQDYIKRKYGCTVKTCWIAHVKDLNGLNPRVVPNRISLPTLKYPCPDDNKLMIEEALRYFGVL